MSKPVRRQGSAVYYARRAVPKDLKEVISRKGDFWKSLDETDLERAKPLERRQQVLWDEHFDELRRRRDAAKLQPAAQVSWSPFQSEEEQEAAEEQARYWDQREAEIEAKLETDPLFRANYEAAQLVREATEKKRDAMQFAELAAEEAKAQARKTGTPLSALLERWASNKTNAKTIDRMKAVVEWFEDDMGRVPVEAITPDHVSRWADKLLLEVKPSNARVKLSNLKALLNNALQKQPRLIAANPAKDIVIDVERSPETEVQPFDLPALKAIFSSPVYSADARPEGGAGDASYWLPLLGLFTGARLNELGQLRPKDIRQVPYVDRDKVERMTWVIFIVADKEDDLRLKNAWSARRVPIHQDLIALGFLRYVEAMRGAGHKRIFPELTPDKYGTITANWSKWFGRYRVNVCKVTDGRMRYHSFRHAFKDYVREAEVGEDVNDALTGHRGETVARKYGSSLNYPLRPLVNAMTEYRVTGLALPAPPPAFRVPVEG